MSQSVKVRRSDCLDRSHIVRYSAILKHNNIARRSSGPNHSQRQIFGSLNHCDMLRQCH